MRTTLVDGKLRYEPLAREERAVESFKDFCRQCTAYTALAPKAGEILAAVDELEALIAGVDAVEKPAKQ